MLRSGLSGHRDILDFPAEKFLVFRTAHNYIWRFRDNALKSLLIKCTACSSLLSSDFI